MLGCAAPNCSSLAPFWVAGKTNKRTPLRLCHLELIIKTLLIAFFVVFLPALYATRSMIIFAGVFPQTLEAVFEAFLVDTQHKRYCGVKADKLVTGKS